MPRRKRKEVEQRPHRILTPSQTISLQSEPLLFNDGVFREDITTFCCGSSVCLQPALKIREPTVYQNSALMKKANTPTINATIPITRQVHSKIIILARICRRRSVRLH